MIEANEGDDAISAGDLARYTVVVNGDIARFWDDPGRGLPAVQRRVHCE